MKGPKQDYSMSLGQVDDDEKLLAVIKRHPFGIIKLYFQIIVGLIGAGALIYFVLPGAFPPDDYAGLYNIVGLLSVLVVVFMVFIAGIATVIYNLSELVVTDKTITQTIQIGLFSKKTSQLAVSSVEDVTANKNGVFPTLFNYGRLLVETAGEQENFHFDYCPHADHYAKLILETRQQFMGSRELELRDTASAYSRSSSPAGHDPSAPAPTVRKQQRKGNPSMRIGAIAADGADDDEANHSIRG